MDRSREYALKGLDEVLSKGAYSNHIIDSFCDKVANTGQEKAFFTRLFLGCIENIFLLDGYISLVSKTPLKKIKPLVLNLLRITVYQLYFMDSVPDYTAISLSLKILEKRKLSGLKPYVNGVLGNISKNKEKLEKEIFKGLSEEGRLSLKYSVPEWIISYLGESIGMEKMEEVLLGLRSPGGICLRVNRDKISIEDAKKKLRAAGVDACKIPDIPAFRLRGQCSPRDIPGFREGEFYIMERSSIETVMAAEIIPGENIIDLCASPGGKGIFASELTGEGGSVLMRDLTKAKVEMIGENVRRMDRKNISIQKHDAMVFDSELALGMDLVIADLPCSGLGNMGSKPEIALRCTMDSIKTLGEIQREILAKAAGYVKGGGRILFSTCTLGNLENEDNVRIFIENNKDFSLCKTKTFLPGKEGSDGFFYALFKKDE